MLKFLRKKVGAKTSLIILSVFILLFLISSIAFAGPYKLGNVNQDPEGTINVLDVVLVVQHVLEIEELDEDQKILANVNCDEDGEINILDVTLLMQYALGIIDQFPCELPKVVSVRAIDRTTIEVELAENVPEETAEDVDFYQVTVGNEAVEVEEVDYDANENEATLTVDMEGKSGELVVNGVKAEDEVPPEPVFESISTTPGAYKVVLHFNTAVYDFDDNLAVGDFNVVTDGNPNLIEEIDAADSVDDAENKITLTLEDATPAETTTEVRLRASGADKVVNIWDEPASAITRSHYTPSDPDAPEFTGVRAIEGGYAIYLDFSKPIHSGNEEMQATAGDASDHIRPLVDFDRVAATDDVKIASTDATESIMLKLDLGTDELISSGDDVSVTLNSSLYSAANEPYIRDLSGNVIEGTRTRVAEIVSGPGLSNAKASTLVYDYEDDLVLEVTLNGDLARNKKITVDLSDLDNNGFDFEDGSVPVSGVVPNASLSNSMLTLNAPIGGIADGTTLTFTIEHEDPLDPGKYKFLDPNVAKDESPHKVVFQRSDVGTTATTEVAVVEGFSAFFADDLISGKDNQPFTFSFEILGDLGEDETIEIDLSELADAGVDFSRVDVDETAEKSTVNGDPLDNEHSLIFVGNVMTIEAGETIDTETEITINLHDEEEADDVLDVAAGATGRYDIMLKRSDSGATAPLRVTIEANIINTSASDPTANKVNQLQRFYYTLDGEMKWNGFVDIVIENSDLTYPEPDPADLEDYYSVSGADAKVVSVEKDGDDYVISVRANEDIACGTEIEVEVDGVDAGDAEDVKMTFTRLDTGNSDEYEFEVK